ncbi:hypothetical protein [Kitasatospora sp. NPDC002965]|uniref:hypothetical protein n=1 Tax=Kitasatospora sp. NPDC002965 TaxID=3154775 RepID=UPI0033B65A54
MNARIRDTKPPARPRSRPPGAVARALTQGLFLLAGLAATVLGFGWFVDANDAASAYRNAPICGTAEHTPGTDCAQRASGRVTARYAATSGDSTIYTLTVARETAVPDEAPRHSYTVDSAFYNATKAGADVDLTVFRGRVAEVSYEGHRAQNAGTPWLISLEIALLAALGSALTAHGLTWSRTGAQATPFYIAMAVFVAAMALFGCLTLISSQLPLAATLAVPVLGWLLMTASITTITWRPRPAG